MSTQSYSKAFVDIRPDIKDPSLVGAWDLRNIDGKLVDLTSLGNDGTPGAFSKTEPSLLGLMRRYLPNSGVIDSSLGAANAFPLDDLTVSIWYRFDTGLQPVGYLFNYFKDTNDGFGVRIRTNGTQIEVLDDIDNAGTSQYQTSVIQGKLVHVILVIKSLEILLYVDSVLIGSGEFTSDNWASFAGTLYNGGSRGDGTSPAAGIVGAPEVYSEAKSAEWIAAKYAQGARAIQLRTDYGVQVSSGDQTAGRLGGIDEMSPYTILSGTWNLTTDVIDGLTAKTKNNIAAGVLTMPTRLFEATPTGAAFGTWKFSGYKGADGNNWQFMPIASDMAAVGGATQDGYNITITGGESLRLQRIDNGAVGATLINSGVAYVANNTWYDFVLTRRYDGYFELYIKGGTFTEWILVGTGTDINHTISNYIVWDLDAGDQAGYSDELGDHGFVKHEGVVRG